ncbi:MAG: hypothetical protein WAR79_12045 [Melioribacteraceae bacterium]
MIKISKIIIVTIFLIIFSESIFSQKNNLSEFQNKTSISSFVPKKAGIAFRIDDNFSLENYQQMAAIFNNYNTNFGRNYHFSFALNFAHSYIIYEIIDSIKVPKDTIHFGDPVFLNTIKDIQNSGHEIMDHTPNHRTNYYITSFPASDYLQQNLAPIDGVDHIVEQGNDKRKICLEFNPIDITGLTPIGTCNVNGNILSGDFSSFEIDKDIYVYLQELGKLLYIFNLNGTKTEATVDDVWQEQVSLGNYSNVTFYKFKRANRLSINGVRVLAQETQKLADLYDIDRPTTWIQPGGRHPIITMTELKQALTPLGYKAGASFVDNVVAGVTQAFKVFNEYDPNDEKKFGIQWEDFNEDKIDSKGGSLEVIKNKIVDAIAKNKIMIGHNHFYDLGSGDYVNVSEYFSKVENILAWCNQNNIEINTYAEWADILYEKTPDPYQNVFPPLNVFINTNSNGYTTAGSIPDGYNLRDWSDHGIIGTDSDAPSQGHYYYSISGYSRIFMIKNLGGIEKGENEFELWTKGSTNDKIRVYFRFPGTNYPEKEYRFLADTPVWTKYNLTNSVNGNTILEIPDDVSTIEIEFRTFYFNSDGDSIKVSGMSLKKKMQSITTNLKVNLEGAYSSVTMNASLTLPNAQPYNISPWLYTGSETITTSVTDIIDWVLIELRSSSTSDYYVHARKAGLLKNDGTIINSDGTQFTIDVAAGNYYVVIYHRNHLPIMSSVAVPFN